MISAGSRRRIVTLHRWLGLALMLWFALLGVTGSLLVYEQELDRWLNPKLLTDVAALGSSAPTLSAQQIVERAQQAFPAAAIERLHLPEPDDAHATVYRLLLRSRADRRIAPRLEAVFGARSGRLLGSRPQDGYGLSAPLLMRTIHDLHHRLLLGNAGKTAVGSAGALLLAMIVLGMTVALPRKHSIRAWRTMLGIRLRAHGIRLVFDLHRSVGVAGFALLLISTFTGLSLAFPDYARDFVGLFWPVRALPQVPFAQREAMPEGAQAPALVLDQILAEVRQLHPHASISEVHLPQRRSGSLLVYLREPGDWHRLGDSLLFIDPMTKSVRMLHRSETRSAGERMLHSLFPLHSGIAFGAPGRLLMCAAGLLPLLLGVTGALIWWRKRAASRVAQQRRIALAG